jgi:hypothetical protein
MRKTYDIIGEPQGILYKALIDYCSAHAQIVLLVLRETDWTETSAHAFLEQFRSILISQDLATEWPGTRLTSETATIFRYRVTPDLTDYLKTKVDRLYEWQQPERFEDLCFLRSDGTTLLATIAHENDAYLELSEKEYFDLINVLPLLPISKHPS